MPHFQVQLPIHQNSNLLNSHLSTALKSNVLGQTKTNCWISHQLSFIWHIYCQFRKNNSAPKIFPCSWSHVIVDNAWTLHTDLLLNAPFCRYNSDTPIVRYAKISQALKDKTVRDVALRCRWMTVSFYLVVFFLLIQ